MPGGAPLRVAVGGAGLGGLTAAVALHQAGGDVEVYEQAPELTEVGGGINLGAETALRVRCHRASEKLIAELARRAASTSHFDLIVVSSARRTVVTSWKT